uniref:TonB-dependent receptor plug domain-containing protein n=1 Tax=Thaumasiovibrio occultus TaxID=1891184 RepID=UPI000B353CEA|nr:TonB-dependent receptor [Thaumasiovibrio occultus]
MPLESLAETKVISATRTAQSLADTPAAVYIITAKEIERFGARTVADALVLAPGLHVAKYSNYDWEISARDTNEGLNNALLVMVDGRSVVNAMFSGVYWDLLPVSIDNVEQIEVMLGPVGTLWGGNAVNGVINIITKDAENSDEGKVSTTFGNYSYQEHHARAAGQVGENTYASGYIEYVDHKPWTTDPSDPRIEPIQHFNVYTERFGARVDYQNMEHTLNLQAGGIRSREDYLWIRYYPDILFPGRPPAHQFETETTAQEFFIGGSHIYSADNGDSIGTDVWLTYNDNDGTSRNASFIRLDFDSHYNIADFYGTQLLLGGNMRLIDERFHRYNEEEYLSEYYVRVIDDPDFFNQSYGVYANWNIPVSDDVAVILGNRWQYHNLTGDVDAQPQARISYQYSEEHFFWAGWGRAIVTPSRLELDSVFRENAYCEKGSCGTTIDPEIDGDYLYQNYTTFGNKDLDVEEIETFELGYRFWNEKQLQLSVNAFYSRKDNIRSVLELKPLGPSSHFGDTDIWSGIAQYSDLIWSETMGGELSVKWMPADDLQINANYSYKRVVGHCDGDVICEKYPRAKGGVESQPNHFANMQVMWDVSPQLWVSATMQYVGDSELPDEYLENPDPKGNDPRRIWPEVLSFDTTASWQHSPSSPQVTLSVENIGADQSKEFPDIMGFPNGLQYWLTVDWDFAQMNKGY